MRQTCFHPAVAQIHPHLRHNLSYHLDERRNLWKENANVPDVRIMTRVRQRAFVFQCQLTSSFHYTCKRHSQVLNACFILLENKWKVALQCHVRHGKLLQGLFVHLLKDFFVRIVFAMIHVGRQIYRYWFIAFGRWRRDGT